MSVFIASAVLISIGSAYAILLKRKLAETLFLSATTVVGILYCFGLSNIKGCLMFGIYFLIAFALACFVYFVLRTLKDKKIIQEAEIIQGLLLYMVFLAASLAFNIGRVFHHWDEFSHWGVAVKYFYSVDALATFTEPGIHGISYPQYFPGTSLFQYFFSRFDSQFVEWYSYVAMNILYFSLIMPLVKDIFDKEKCIKSISLLIIFFLLPLQNASFYSSLYVDQILGAFFGFTLIYYFAYRYEQSAFGVLIVSASIFMATVTKDVGMILALGAIAVIILDTILFRRKDIEVYFFSSSSILSGFWNTTLLLMPLASTIFAKITWSSLLVRSGFRATGAWRRPSLYNIYSLILGQVEPYQMETARNLLSAAFSRNIRFLPLSAFEFCAVFIFAVAALSILKVSFTYFCTRNSM